MTLNLWFMIRDLAMFVKLKFSVLFFYRDMISGLFNSTGVKLKKLLIIVTILIQYYINVSLHLNIDFILNVL